MEKIAATSAVQLICKSDARQPQWPPEAIEFAFNAWAFLDNYDCAAVSRRLASGEYAVDDYGDPLAMDIPIRTLRDWVTRHNWHERHEQFIQQSAGGILKRIVGNMLQVALNGSNALDQQVRQGIPPSRDLVEAVKLATSIAGLSAIGSRDPSKGVLAGGSATKRSRHLSALSDAELQAAERATVETEDMD